jgi:hypothetical protein
VVASLLGTVSYAVEWLSNRGLATPSESNIALAYRAGRCAARALALLPLRRVRARGRLLWAAAAGVVLAPHFSSVETVVASYSSSGP